MAKKKKRDELVFLEDMLECIEKIEEYIDGLTEKEFEDNSEKQDAVIRRIEIIGEAVKNISKGTREKIAHLALKTMLLKSPHSLKSLTLHKRKRSERTLRPVSELLVKIFATAVSINKFIKDQNPSSPPACRQRALLPVTDAHGAFHEGQTPGRPQV